MNSISHVRKNLKASLLKSFPTLTDEDLSVVVPNKEEMSVMKIETHSGLIVTAHLLGKKPIVFHDREQLYPTIFFLWLLPPDKPLFHYFTTWHEVVPKLANGADLMLPGIIVESERGPAAYGKLAKGVKVAVNTNRNKAAVAVGLTALSSEDMYMAGKRGKGIEILHCIGDYLWQLAGTKESPPDLGPPSFLVPPTPSDVEQSSENPAAAPTEDQQQPSQSEEAANPVSVETNEEIAAPEEPSEPAKSPQQAMDELLDYCFLKALKTTAKKIELPVLTSNFYRLHIVPACPADKSLDVKKTSFKKLSKFLEVQSIA